MVNLRSRRACEHGNATRFAPPDAPARNHARNLPHPRFVPGVLSFLACMPTLTFFRLLTPALLVRAFDSPDATSTQPSSRATHHGGGISTRLTCTDALLVLT